MGGFEPPSKCIPESKYLQLYLLLSLTIEAERDNHLNVFSTSHTGYYAISAVFLALFPNLIMTHAYTTPIRAGVVHEATYWLLSSDCSEMFVVCEYFNFGFFTRPTDPRLIANLPTPVETYFIPKLLQKPNF